MKTQFIKNAQVAFLRDTVKFYNSNNRAVNEEGGCVYHPTQLSPGCAIGRHMLNKALCHQWTYKSLGGYVQSVQDSHPGTLGPLEVLGIGFLSAVQELHDWSFHWTPAGVSESGLRYVRRVCEAFELPVDQVLG